MIKAQKASLREDKTAPNDVFISLQHINKIYPNRVQAVFDFNLDIKEREFIVFVGPSGCGKSTTLRMIAGLEEITGGDLYIDGEFANELEPKDRDTAMVFQSYALYPHMTVYDNMAFGLQMRHVPKPEIEERVKKAAEILQITEYLDRKPKALSGGQCQRVALGRAIVRNAKVFLMDEPLSNLDAKLRVQMRSEIVKLHNELGATTIYVTHDQIEAMTMASRIVVMNKGYIQQIGSPKVIYNHPANTFVATFIGSPAMNIIEGTFKKDHIELGDVVSIKVNKETIEAHNNFYKEEIEKANNRIEEIKHTLILYEETKENKKGEQPAIDIDAINAEVESDPEVIELRNSIAHYEDCLNNKEGHPILFGIRPEDIMEKTSAVLLKNPSDHMKLKVSIAELLGNEYYAHIDFLGKDVIAKVNAELNVEKDQILDLTFNLDKYCLFDKVNGRNIKPYKE
ncbi:MAG: ATP-binding cassette domain-containing protein [Bacilli bacterium]|nr:ATP-binding cassette domain-containing protein [Bacilli bacterium]